MTDDNDDDAMTINRSVASDPFTMLFNLLALLADSRAFKRSLQGLHRAMVAADEAEKQLVAKAAAFSEYERTTRAALERREGELDDREVSLKSIKDRREFDLADREARIAALEREWRFVGEDDDVKRGFRTAQFSALMKARASYGVSADAVMTTPAPAPPPIRPTFLQDDADRRDVSGLEFPPSTTITRSM